MKLLLHCVSVWAVSPFPEERWQQVASDVAAEKEVQKQNHPGLQNVGRWTSEYVSGKCGQLVSIHRLMSLLIAMKPGVLPRGRRQLRCFTV